MLQAKYHEDFEKNIKGSKIQVADDPETQRLKQLNAIVSQVEYKGLKEKVNEMEIHRQSAAAQGLIGYHSRLQKTRFFSKSPRQWISFWFLWVLAFFSFLG